ncbi:MAG TPA: CheR family methyltransferase [Xanthobacteraceae bacterium]|jgi:chemotaxis methyl-accepting protein methylase
MLAKSNLMTMMIGRSLTRRTPVNLYIRLNTWFWPWIPPQISNSWPVRSYGRLFHRLVCRYAQRRQFTGTSFLRNRPQLELMRRLVDRKLQGSALKIAVLGCSIGADVYSILFTIRSARPDLAVTLCAVDYSAEVLTVAKEALYTNETCQLVGSSIFERMTDAEFREMFEGDTSRARVRSWIREGISWHLGDAGDPELVRGLGPQDIVVANNFLCHMQQSQAEYCLRNIAGLPRPGGYFFVTGIDLDVRTKVARELRWQPVTELIKQIHEGDLSVRRDWPYKWWGLEPLDVERDDWQLRYATVFQLNETG